jgi:hypothetical protein
VYSTYICLCFLALQCLHLPTRTPLVQNLAAPHWIHIWLHPLAPHLTKSHYSRFTTDYIPLALHLTTPSVAPQSDYILISFTSDCTAFAPHLTTSLGFTSANIPLALNLTTSSLVRHMTTHSLAPRLTTHSLAPRLTAPSLFPHLTTSSLAPYLTTPSLAPHLTTPSLAPHLTAPSLALYQTTPSLAPHIPISH